MYTHFENGTLILIDESRDRINTLRTIGSTLPFDTFTIYLRFDKQSYFDKNKYYLLNRDFTKTEVTETHVVLLARKENVLLLNQSQFKLLVELAIKDNVGITRLSRNVCELIYKIGFMTEQEYEKINFDCNSF